MAFGTPWGLFEFCCVPFGLYGVAATFKHLMDCLLAPHQAYASAYLDNVIIFLEHWNQDLEALQKFFQELHGAELTANPSKHTLAQKETQGLSFQVGQGKTEPLADKIQALKVTNSLWQHTLPL